MSNPLRSLDATTQIHQDIAASIQALSPQHQKGAETGGIAPNHHVDELHSDGSQSRLRLDGAFLASVALLTVDRTLSDPPDLFKGIEVSAIGRPIKTGAGDYIECFFRLLCSMK
jgi:hypothetical protein